MDPDELLARLRPADAAEKWQSSARPWISVEAFSDFVICRRAGQLQWENERFEPHAPPDTKAWLSFSRARQYSLAQIQVDLAEVSGPAQKWVLLYLGWVGLFFVAFTGLGHGWLPWRWYLFANITTWESLLAPLLLSPWAGLRIYQLWVSTEREREAKDARPDEPDPRQAKPQPVHWWSLLKAGYDSSVPQQDYQHESWGLVGRPWRVLRRGRNVVPVIVYMPAGSSPDEPPEHRYLLQAQAYCELLAACEAATCPL